MTFDRQAHFQRQLQHLISMAKLPGWKAYAWRRAQDLDAEASGLFAGMADALKAAMTGGQGEGSESVDQCPTKPRSPAPKSGTGS